jgi:hypothetical protein
MAEQLDMWGGGDFEVAGKPAPNIQKVLDIYNEVAALVGWRKSTVCDDARITAIRRAMKTYGGLAGWKTALERASKSTFLTTAKGRYKNGEETWKGPSLDFFLQQKSIRNLLEGVYDDPVGGFVQPAPKKNWNDERIAKAKAALDRLN